MKNHSVLLALLAIPALVACGGADESASPDIESESTPLARPITQASESLLERFAPVTLVAAPAQAAPVVTTTTTPTSAPTVAAPASVVPSGPVPYRGVNLDGGEFGSAIPGVDGVDYRFPTTAEIDHFVAKGMNTFRIAFTWERLQPSAKGEFVAAYVAHLDELVAHATAKNAFVILHPQNFGRYYGNVVGSSAVPNEVFADFWSRMAKRYGANSRVMFNLENEPHDLPTEQWVGAANAAVTAIRATGATNTLIVPGNGWTGAWTWSSTSYGTPNSVAMLDVTDPADNMLYEVHQYFDETSQGLGGVCVSGTVGSERLKPFVDWLKANHKKGFVGEFAGGTSATCASTVNDMLTYVNANADVLLGWSWWAAGPGWGDSYPLTLEPAADGTDRPQMAWLAPFLAR
jgi:endoglucanase